MLLIILYLAFITAYCYFVIYFDQIVVPIGIFSCAMVLFGGMNLDYHLSFIIAIVVAIACGIGYFYITFWKKDSSLENFMSVHIMIYMFAFFGFLFLFRDYTTQLLATNDLHINWFDFTPLHQLSATSNLLEVVTDNAGFTFVFFFVDLFLKYNWKKKRVDVAEALELAEIEKAKAAQREAFLAKQERVALATKAKAKKAKKLKK